MKTLYLVRHAKSSWDDSALDDRDRPLTQRGMTNAEQGANVMKSFMDAPEILITSPAKRANDTAVVYRDALVYSALMEDERLYTFVDFELLEVIFHLDDKEQSVALFGHEPAISGCVNRFLVHSIEKIPTGSITKLLFNTAQWSKISQSNLVSARHYNRHHWQGFKLQ